MLKPPNIPGVGAVTDTLDFVKNLWGGLGVPGMAAPTLSVDDLDKKIADLKAVEAWLALNSSMVRGTIQALEVQRGTIAALKSMGDAFAQAAAKPAGAAEAKARTAAEAPKAHAAGAAGAEPSEQAAAPGANAESAQLGNPAMWWNMLQEQFKQAVSAAISPETMAEAAARAQDAAAKMAAAAMPPADLGKTVAESMAKAGATAAPAKRAPAKPRAPRTGADKE